VIGHAAAIFVEEIVAGVKGSEEIVERLNVVGELIEPGVEEFRTVDEEGFVWAEGGVDLSWAIGGVCRVVVLQRVGRIISGSDGVDEEFSEESLSGKVVSLKAFITEVPEFLGGIGAEEDICVEAAAELQMGPVIQRISQSVGDSFGPGLEFFAR